MQTHTHPASTKSTRRNEYSEMARSAFDALCTIATCVTQHHPEPTTDLRQAAVSAISDLWHRLVWSDRSLNANECAVLDVIMEECQLAGLEFPSIEIYERDAVHELPLLLIHTREHDDSFGTRYTGAVINHLETFGYAVLASDRRIDDPEMKTLHSYIRNLRQSAMRNPSVLMI